MFFFVLGTGCHLDWIKGCASNKARPCNQPVHWKCVARPFSLKNAFFFETLDWTLGFRSWICECIRKKQWKRLAKTQRNTFISMFDSKLMTFANFPHLGAMIRIGCFLTRKLRKPFENNVLLVEDVANLQKDDHLKGNKGLFELV